LIEAGFVSSPMDSKPEIADVIYAFLYQLLTSSRPSMAKLSALDLAVATPAARESVRRRNVSTLLPHWPKWSVPSSVQNLVDRALYASCNFSNPRLRSSTSTQVIRIPKIP